MVVSSDLVALGQILLIDVTLAGDNAIVVGMAAATVRATRRRLVIACGIGLAVALRLCLALAAKRMLTVIGLTLAGGILLLWVAWKLYRQLRGRGDGRVGSGKRQSSFMAIVQIAVADLSMSLDNILAVAGAAVGHPGWVLAGGLAVAVLFMAVASELIARLLGRFPWIAYAGLAMVVFVASRMIWIGGGEVNRAWM